MQIKTTWLNIILGIASRQVSPANSGLLPLLNIYNLSYALFGIFDSTITGRINRMITCKRCLQIPFSFQGLSLDSGLLEFYFCYLKGLWSFKNLANVITNYMNTTQAYTKY